MSVEDTWTDAMKTYRNSNNERGLQQPCFHFAPYPRYVLCSTPRGYIRKDVMMRITMTIISDRRHQPHCQSIIRRMIILLLVLLIPLVSSSTTVPRDIERILRDGKYDRHASPAQEKNYPTEVNVSMYIEGLSSFQAQTMDFHVDIYFQEEWIDERLKHTNEHRVLIRDSALFNMMWHPDLYFANARESQFHEVTAPNFLVWIHPDGRVYYDCRISLTVMCMMDLARYPLDRQKCDLRIMSYAYDEEQISIQWANDMAISRNREITLPDMKVLNISMNTCNGTFPVGVWSCITAIFIVQREIMHHILQSYLPTALIVIISWFSFWLDVDSVPGRVSLCITTLLTLATQSSAARMALPQVSYIKAIDVWMGTCLAFVFGVMIEFTLVNYWSRRKPPAERFAPESSRKPKPTTTDVLKQWSALARESPLRDLRCMDSLRQPVVMRKRPAAGNGVIPTTEDQCTCPDQRKPAPAMDGRCNNQEAQWTAILPAVQENNSPPNQKEDLLTAMKKESAFSNDRLRLAYRQESRKTAQKIDRLCRILFPVTFILFNIAYWIFYSKDWEWDAL